MGASTRFGTKLALREGTSVRGAELDAFADSIMEHFDQGTQRAILRLYRSAPPDVLEAAGARLNALTCPALVVWGDRDPYLPARFADAYAAALGGDAEVLHLPGRRALAVARPARPRGQDLQLSRRMTWGRASAL